MSFAKAWSGDWHGRIVERVNQRGFATLMQFAGECPGVSLWALAHELGPEDVAAVQIRSVLVDEAVKMRMVPHVLRDLLVRELRSALPTGWRSPLDEHARYQVGGALASWKAELTIEDQLHCFDDDMTFEAGQRLLDAELPDGWLPEGPSDPIIVVFVERCLGHAPS